MDIINNLGAALTLGMGLLGLLFPARASTLVGLQAVTNAGRSEFRATFGGLFAAAGVVCLVQQLPGSFFLAGMMWIGAAAGRVVSIIVDKAGDGPNWGGVGFELAAGAALVAGRPLAWAAG